MKPTHLKRIGVLLALGGVGCRAAVESEPAPRVVRSIVVQRATLTEWGELAGRVVPPPDREATVAPQVAGRLTAVSVIEGDEVRSGQLLARVEAASLDDAVVAAEAGLNRAAAEAVFRRAVAGRSEDLLAKGVVARQEIEADQASVAAAEAARDEATSALATTRRRRSWADVTAPFDGVVVAVLRRAGDYVDGSPATPVLELATARDWEVAADATPELLARIESAQEALVDGVHIVPALTARVTKVSRAVNATTGAGGVRLRVTQQSPSLPLGTPVRVHIALGRRADALVVPATALRRSETGSSEVVVVASGHARVRPVTVGLREQGRVEVVSGLSDGDVVVVEDPLALAEGAEVLAETAQDNPSR